MTPRLLKVDDANYSEENLATFTVGILSPEKKDLECCQSEHQRNLSINSPWRIVLVVRDPFAQRQHEAVGPAEHRRDGRGIQNLPVVQPMLPQRFHVARFNRGR